jgi:hypothetical protein
MAVLNRLALCGLGVSAFLTAAGGLFAAFLGDFWLLGAGCVVVASLNFRVLLSARRDLRAFDERVG